jgi:hypothetical protein
MPSTVANFDWIAAAAGVCAAVGKKLAVTIEETKASVILKMVLTHSLRVRLRLQISRQNFRTDFKI